MAEKPNGGKPEQQENDPGKATDEAVAASKRDTKDLVGAAEKQLEDGTQVWDYAAPRHHPRTVGPTGVPLIWVASNRTDNRAVGFWVDEHQPGGQVFLGPGAELVARTSDIEALLMQGLIVEVPEPRRWKRDPQTGEDEIDERGKKVPNPKYPAPKIIDPTTAQAAQPGRPTPLGRSFDPDLWDEEHLQAIREKQARLPREIGAPVGGIVPGVTHPVS